MTSDPALADDLRIALQRLVRRIRHNRGSDSISDAQLAVLFHLTHHGEATPGLLAEKEHVTPPSMNRTVNGLEEAGLVTRSPDPTDARRVIVRLTDAGRDLIAETKRLRTAWFSTRLDGLTPDELALLEAAAPVIRKLAEE